MKTLIIDSQILTSYQECACKCHYTFNKNIKPPIKEESFDKGGLLHDMLEMHYGLLKDWYKKESNLPREVYDTFVEKTLILGQQSASQRDLDTEDCLRVIGAYRQYADFRFGESWIPKFIEQVGAKELWKGIISSKDVYDGTHDGIVHYKKEEEELQILYAGKVDLVAQIEWDDEKPAIIDHKTEERASDPIQLNNQMMGYAWMFDVRNIIVNKVGFQNTLPPAAKFRRYTLHYPESVLNEWKENTIRWAIKLYHSLQDLKAMENDRNYHSCAGKYGKPCGLLPICITEPAARDWKINSSFLIGEEWDVTRRLAKERN